MPTGRKRKGVVFSMIDKFNVQKVLAEAPDRTIVAATKYADVEDIKELVDLGINDIGENRVEAFLEKYEVLHDLDIIWHFIGHLQSKKVKKIINQIDYLHSLDRLSVAEEIQKFRKLPLKCFVEVNVSGEISKNGLEPKEVSAFCENLRKYDKIQVVGLMGIAELTYDETVIESQFNKLADLKISLNDAGFENIKYLSMGMSNDYEIAMRCGSTHLRLGSMLFIREE